MRHQRVFLAVTLVGGLMLLAACFRLAGAPINLLSVKTIVNEDESGSSTFLFVVPSDAECKLLPLRPELERLKEQAGTQVYFANYQDNEYKGFQLTYEFKSPQQIPEQIDRVKHALVQALATAYPTPAPGALGFAHPDPDTYGVFDPNELSIQIEPMLETVGSREWKATIKLTPLMLTVPGSTEPSPSCGIPRITYDLTMPGEIATFKTGADAEADVRRYVQVTRPAPNTIRWTIEIPQGPSTPAEATKIADEIAKAPSDQERLAKIKQVFIGSTYTLTATSATPGSWFQTLTQVVAPILGLVATAIGIIVGVIKIRETLEAKAKASGKAKQ
jgi:hypothetical protein